MNLTRKGRLTAAGVMAVALLASACSTKAPDSSDSAASPGGNDAAVKTGPGVTDDTITIAALTDMTNVYATLGKSLTQAQQLYVDELNEAGGICDRKVELVVRDHAYDVQKGVAAYSELEPQIAGIVQLIGSPIVTALLDSIDQDKMLTIPAAWPSTLLSDEHIQIVGTTYDVEMINGIDYLVREKGLTSGAKLGHVYFEGEYGENALLGSKYAADKLGLEIVEQKIKATDNDMTAQVAAFKSAGVNAILVSAGPRQVASLAGVAAAAGLDVPIVSNSPGFAPQLLATPAGPALIKNVYVVTPAAPFGAENPGVQKLAAAYTAKHPDDVPDYAVVFGYASAHVFAETLKKACENKDLSREGIIAAHRSQSKVDTDGLTATMDFSGTGQPPTRQTYILQPNADIPGGLVIGEELREADMAAEYPMPTS